MATEVRGAVTNEGGKLHENGIGPQQIDNVSLTRAFSCVDCSNVQSDNAEAMAKHLLSAHPRGDKVHCCEWRTDSNQPAMLDRVKRVFFMQPYDYVHTPGPVPERGGFVYKIYLWNKAGKEKKAKVQVSLNNGRTRKRKREDEEIQEGGDSLEVSQEEVEQEEIPESSEQRSDKETVSSSSSTQRTMPKHKWDALKKKAKIEHRRPSSGRISVRESWY